MGRSLSLYKKGGIKLMKNVVIIHGYNGDTSQTFGPYVKNECEKRKIECILPKFPMKQEATFENWKEIMDGFMNQITEDTIFVAHSLGAQFIPKYLALQNRKINTYISIAGFINDHSGREDLRVVLNRFQPNEKDFEDLIKLTKNRYAIYSDNDHLNPQEELEKYAEKINAKKVFIKGVRTLRQKIWGKGIARSHSNH